MTDLATIGVIADTRDLKRGEVEMNRFARTGEITERRVVASGGKMTAAFSAVSSSAVRMAGVAGAALGAFLGGRMFAGAIREQEQLQTNMLKTQGIIEATGGAAGRSAAQLLDDARALARATLLSTEGVMSAQQTMLTFRHITGETFDRAIKAAADLSEAMGTDLNSAVLQLGKALEDPITGMTALTRSGTVFTQSQKELVKGMVDVGNVAGAQAFILGELEKQYGGVAKAAAGGLAGVVDGLGQSWQEFQIALADTLGLGDGASALLDGISSSLEYLTAHMDVIKGAFVIIAAPVRVAWGLFKEVAKALEWVLSPLAPIFTGLGNLISAFGTIGGSAEAVKTPLEEVYAAADALNAALGTFSDTATPAAGQSAIDMASNYVDLAAAARESAAGVLADLQARISARKVMHEQIVNGVAPGGDIFGNQEIAQMTSDLELAQSEFDKATAALAAANAAKLRVNYEVAGGMSSSVIEDVPNALGALNSELDKLRRQIDPSINRLENYTQAMDLLKRALATSTITQEEFNIRASQVEKAFGEIAAGAGAARAGVVDLAPAIETLGDKLKTLGSNALGQVSSAFTDFFNRGLKDFGSFAKSILSTFTKMLLQMIWAAKKNKIMLSLGIGGGGGSGGGGIGGKLIGKLLGGGIGSFATAATAGTAAVAGTGLMGGLGASLGVGGAGSGLFAVGANAAAAGGGVMASIGAALPIIGIGLAIFGLFKMFSRKPPISQKDFRIVQNGLELTGKAMLDTGWAGQVAAANIVKYMGGIKKFESVTNGYYNNFFTNEEKRQRSIAAIDSVFADMGMTTPKTAMELRSMVEAQDLTTEAGQKTYSALLGVSDAFAKVYGGVNDTATALDRLNNQFGGNIFSTLVDQQRASAYQTNGIDYLTARPESVGSGATYRGTGPRVITRDNYNAQAAAAKQADEIAAQTGLLQTLLVDGKKLLRLQQQWEGAGMPPTRTQ